MLSNWAGAAMWRSRSPHLSNQNAGHLSLIWRVTGLLRSSCHNQQQLQWVGVEELQYIFNMEMY